jgi:hypothetical protein
MPARREMPRKKEDSMARFRLSIATLMVVMIPFAIGLAAFQSATQLWVNLVFNLVVVVLLVATYQAKSSQGIDGAWWAGFASFGWCHLVMGLLGMPWARHYGDSQLITAEITTQVVALLESDNSAAVLQRAMGRAVIVHCVLCIVFGLLGATIFSRFAARRIASEQADRRLTGDAHGLALHQ